MKFLKSFESYLPKWKMKYVDELEQEEMGNVLQPFEIVEYITSFHDMDSYDDSDISDRCEQYNEFILKFIDISDINLDEFMLDDDKVSEYVELYREINKYPTIVVGETDNGYTIIDGLHRANALSELGFKKIRAYVGEK